MFSHARKQEVHTCISRLAVSWHVCSQATISRNVTRWGVSTPGAPVAFARRSTLAMLPRKTIDSYCENSSAFRKAPEMCCHAQRRGGCAKPDEPTIPKYGGPKRRRNEPRGIVCIRAPVVHIGGTAVGMTCGALSGLQRR